ncbi:MAG: methyltransferase domain-containing protein [Armatimonadetes bacterium]|nr:methyltransferase domain-containing protein [Armatimonadota bacterium]
MNEPYDPVAAYYDLLISWKARLRRERPLFARVFKEHKVRRILDTACGTGRHAFAFQDWGYHVIAADSSPEMVAKARKNAGDRPIAFVEAGFTELAKSDGMFDAVTCLGNSLPHVLSDEELDASLRSMYDVLVPGGAVIIQNNNYDMIVGRAQRFMPIAARRSDGKEYLFQRFFDFHGDTLTFNLVTMVKERGDWAMHVHPIPQRALTSGLLASKLEAAGFENVRFYGGYPAKPFVSLESDVMVAVARRPHTLFSAPRPEPVRAIDAVPIRENGEPLVSLEEAAPEIELREKPAWGRKTVVEMLLRANAMLPSGHHLKVNTLLRTLDRQREVYARITSEIQEKHPEWPKSRLRREINKFLAPPDAKHPPGHTTGGAVDVTIVGPEGCELDMVSSLDGEEKPFLATMPLYSRKATPHAARNRQMLADVMASAGFSSYPGEWWHYSYGDSAWAVRTGAPCALYGAAEISA